MTQQVLYSTISGAVLQWQDTSALNYGAAPSGTATLAVTASEWAAQSEAFYILNGGLTAGTAPVPIPTIAQQATTLLASGLTITSTATPALNATYAADPTTISYINSELSAIMLNATFADGTATVEWPDASGALHVMTVAQFKTFAAALGAFVAGGRKCVIGVTGATLPSAIASIP
jgi:hypothetical protein